MPDSNPDDRTWQPERMDDHHAPVDGGQVFLKNDAATLVLTADGQMDRAIPSTGLYIDDMAVFSRFALTLDGRPPVHKETSLRRAGTMLHIAGENEAGTVAVTRALAVDGGRVHEEIILENKTDRPLTLPVEISYAATFDDIFERRSPDSPGRGYKGALHTPVAGPGGSVSFAYDGFADPSLMPRRMESGLRLSGAPQAADGEKTIFTYNLPPGGRKILHAAYGAGPPVAQAPDSASFAAAARNALADFDARKNAGAAVTSSDPGFDAWLRQSQQDLTQLVRVYDTGPYPHAGIPWFNTTFGRDGIITALQVMWLNPSLGAGVLRRLAATQAVAADPFRDAEPGKIMHEARECETARTNEVPFGRYYGGVDTTPLFIMLAAEYYRRTGDGALIHELMPQLKAAEGWMERRMQAHPDHFLSYQRGSDTGLSNQGWKDSSDSVFHEDGADPAPPIALCEVQGYAWAAWQGLAELTAADGDAATAAGLRAKADDLQARFEQKFWDEKLGTYVLAVDGAGRPCRVPTSNAGHLLFAGVVPDDKAARVRDRLMGHKSFSGYGIRTLETGAARYKPLSYHNGSVWAHDTAVCALGLGRYGFTDDAAKLLQGLYAAVQEFPRCRMPELFGGQQKGAEALERYPAACSPQAWAAGSVFMALQGTLGLGIDCARDADSRLTADAAALPPEAGAIDISGLRVGRETLSLRLDPKAAEPSVLRREAANGNPAQTAPLRRRQGG